jgi:mRNA interferase RelE/StbE
MAYQVIVPKRIKKEIYRIPLIYRQKIFASLSVLANNPHKGKKLGGKHKNHWSLRAWPYRIIYEIKEQVLIVLIVNIGHRQGVYQ